MKPQTGEPQDPPEPQEPLPEPIPAPPPPPPAGLTLIGTNGHDLLVGSSGADVIYGLGGDDLLHGGAGDDLIYGGEGDDVLVGNAGADRLDGGAGVDVVSYAWSPSTWGVSVDLALGRGLRGDAEGDTYFGIEHVHGSSYHDLLAGTAANNHLWGASGNDTIYGRAGNDQLFGGEGDDWLDGGADGDWLDGGAGEDTVRYTGSSAGITVNLAIGTTTGAGVGGDAAGDFYVGIENVNGSEFADVLIGTVGDNKLWGDGGDDQLFGGAGNDQLSGGDGNDALRGGAGADYLHGGAGIDTVYFQDSSARVAVYLDGAIGRDGDAEGDSYYGIENVVGSNYADSIVGTAGSNDLVGLGGDDGLGGGAGNDRLNGGDGDDSLNGGAGADRLDGGNGRDEISYNGAGSAVTVNLATGVGTRGDAQGDTYFGIEDVTSSNFDDVIIGNAGNNILSGSGGNDTLVGGAGQDRLIAFSGHDTLTGDSNGIVAADTFVFRTAWSSSQSGSATITDFQQGVDKIDLMVGTHHPQRPNFGTDGELAWGFVDQDGLHANALDASDRFFFDTATHTLYACDFSSGTLVLGDAVVTVGDDVARLQTSDFLLA
jgi:Ca2+-binding RTX toxin-like protein